jgi:hypothetical protein
MVVAVPYAGHRRFDAAFGPSLGIFDRDYAASVTVMHEPTATQGPPVMRSLIQRVEHEPRVRCSGHAPADDTPRVCIGRRLDEARPGRHMGEVRATAHGGARP